MQNGWSRLAVFGGLVKATYEMIRNPTKQGSRRKLRQRRLDKTKNDISDTDELWRMYDATRMDGDY